MRMVDPVGSSCGHWMNPLDEALILRLKDVGRIGPSTSAPVGVML